MSVSNASGTCALHCDARGRQQLQRVESERSLSCDAEQGDADGVEPERAGECDVWNNRYGETLGGSGTGALTFSQGASTGCTIDASTGVISVSNASGTCSISASKAATITMGR